MFLSRKRRMSSVRDGSRLVPVLLTIMFMVMPILAIADVGPEIHVALVDRATDYDVAKLNGPEVTILEDYGAFVMVEATDETLSRLSVRRDLDDRSVLGLAGYSFDTGEGLPEVPEDLLQAPPEEGHGYFLVQFKGPIRAEWKATLESMGAEPRNYIPNFAYIVGMDVSIRDDVESLPFVTWVGHYQPAFKVSPVVWKWSGVLRLDIALHEGEDAGPVVTSLVDMGAIIIVVSADQVNPTIEALIEDIDIPKVARLNAVWWLEIHYTGGQPPNDPAQWVVQSNIQDYTPFYDNGIHGENMTIGNADTGVHVAHLAFHDANRPVQYTAPGGNTPPDTQHRKIVNYWTFGDDTDEYAGGHGTRTAGVNVGNNIANNGNPQYRGIAYEAKLSFQDVWDDGGFADARPDDKGDMYDRTWRDGGWIHSGSLVCFAGGEYNTEAMELDQFLWAHKDFLGVIANHNYGSGDVPNSVCDLASAKSTMSMGAIENAPNQEDLHDYTGRGPTDDGRLKPTLASVTDINAPSDNTQNGFDEIGGTSGSTPGAAGAMVLARQYFYDGFYPSGVRKEDDGFNASGALMKAMAVNSAEEMTGNNANEVPYNSMDYPSNTQGWGRLNLDQAMYFAGDMRGLFIDENTTGLSTGETSLHEVAIVGDEMPVEVTLVWTDYWGQPLAVKELVNDLDLKVEAPDGTIYKGNVIGGSSYPHESVTGGNFDDLNVVENVINITPQAGIWKINITAVNTPQGPQPFAMVFTGNTSKPDDLVIRPADIKFSVGDPNEGDNITVNVSLRNLGGNPFAGIDALIKLDGEVLETKSIPVPWGGYAKFEMEPELAWGDHTITVELDPNDLVTETFENNNLAQRTVYVNKLPTAHFVADPLEIQTYDNITVNASTSEDDGNITKFKFDWGDGKVSNWQPGPEASHQYKADGAFDVTVQVMDNRSQVSDWAPNVTITVNNRGPWVNASASTYQAYTYINISFDGTGSGDLDGSITYDWDLGDDNSTNLTTFQHAYIDDGLYNVTLTVTDDDGEGNTTKFEIEVLNRRPTASFTSTGSFGDANTQFNFIPTVDDIDGKVVAFLWDFGDGNTSTDEAPFHRYGDDGIYNVTFKVVDDDGAESDLHNWLIEIINVAPEANLTVNTTEALTYDKFLFTSTSFDIDGYVAKLSWNMGDGTFYSGETVEHFYRDDGLYRITLKVEDDDMAPAETNLTVRVLNRAPVIQVDLNTTIIAGNAVNLTAEGSWDKDGNIISFMWDFGNDTVRRGNVVSYTFWSPGTYYVDLTITDNDLAVTQETLEITVQAPPPPPPPGKDPRELNMNLIWALIVALIAVIAVVMTVMMIRARKKEMTQEEPPPGVDPDAVAAEPGPDVEAYPGYATDDSGEAGYEFSGYSDEPIYEGPAEGEWPSEGYEATDETTAVETLPEEAPNVEVLPEETPKVEAREVPKAEAKEAGPTAEPVRAEAKKVGPKK